jgi:aminoglycoside phosphotransferase (APT) family kinase protein
VALADEDRARLAERLPEYRDWCARLAEAGPAPGLNHDDLHDGNVLVGTGGGYGFFDWGDASVAHPFSVLLVTLRACASTFDLAPDDPAVLRVRDAYLDVFGDDGFGDPADLLDLARVATQAAKVGRALSWRRGLVDAEAADLAEFGDAVPGWLAEILTPGPL